MTGLRWASFTELEFVYNRKKKTAFKGCGNVRQRWKWTWSWKEASTVLSLRVWLRDLVHTLKFGFFCLKQIHFSHAGFCFKVEKEIYSFFQSKGNSVIFLKKVTKNLVYRLERRLDFLKTVEIITHRALLQLLLSGNYNGCCQNQICLTG